MTWLWHVSDSFSDTFSVTSLTPFWHVSDTFSRPFANHFWRVSDIKMTRFWQSCRRLFWGFFGILLRIPICQFLHVNCYRPEVVTYAAPLITAAAANEMQIYSPFFVIADCIRNCWSELDDAIYTNCFAQGRNDVLQREFD